MDVDGLTFVCAMTVEERVARRLGPAVRVGLGVANGVPESDRLVSFGIAGALRGDLPVGTVIDATRVVDERGAVLWEGGPLGVSRARTGTILGAGRIVDDPSERARFSAVVGILGMLLVPFIHLSVYLFRTLHPQPIVLKPSRPSLPPEMLRTLLVSTAVFTLLYLGLMTMRYGLAAAEEAREEIGDAG